MIRSRAQEFAPLLGLLAVLAVSGSSAAQDAEPAAASTGYVAIDPSDDPRLSHVSTRDHGGLSETEYRVEGSEPLWLWPAGPALPARVGHAELRRVVFVSGQIELSVGMYESDDGCTFSAERRVPLAGEPRGVEAIPGETQLAFDVMVHGQGLTPVAPPAPMAPAREPAWWAMTRREGPPFSNELVFVSADGDAFHTIRMRLPYRPIPTSEDPCTHVADALMDVHFPD